MALQNITVKFVNLYNKFEHCLLQKDYPLLNKYARQKEMEKGNVGVVFMLHRVCEHCKGHLRPNEDLKISPSQLQRIIEKYKKADFAFLSLDEIYDIMMAKKEIDKPFISFTLDDGYLDNYTNAYPVFKKNNIPFCIFVATDFIDRKAILWWYSIEQIILSDAYIKLDDVIIPCNTYQEKWDAFRILRERILGLNQKKLYEELNWLFSFYNIDWYGPVQSLAMTWEQIQDLSKDSLCTIGAHTITHPAFCNLSEKEILQEAIGGMQRIQSIIHRPIYHFAYPYGSAKEVGLREYEILKSLDFKTAFVSYGGCINKHRYEGVALPRFMLK